MLELSKSLSRNNVPRPWFGWGRKVCQFSQWCQRIVLRCGACAYLCERFNGNATRSYNERLQNIEKMLWFNLLIMKWILWLQNDFVFGEPAWGNWILSTKEKFCSHMYSLRWWFVAGCYFLFNIKMRCEFHYIRLEVVGSAFHWQQHGMLRDMAPISTIYDCLVCGNPMKSKLSCVAPKTEEECLW